MRSLFDDLVGRLAPPEPDAALAMWNREHAWRFARVDQMMSRAAATLFADWYIARWPAPPFPDYGKAFNRWINE